MVGKDVGAALSLLGLGPVLPAKVLPSLSALRPFKLPPPPKDKDPAISLTLLSIPSRSSTARKLLEREDDGPVPVPGPPVPESDSSRSIVIERREGELTCARYGNVDGAEGSIPSAPNFFAEGVGEGAGDGVVIWKVGPGLKVDVRWRLLGEG